MSEKSECSCKGDASINGEKSQSDNQLADAMRSYEETRAILAVTKKRISKGWFQNGT